MKITWVKEAGTENDTAFLGNIYLGGIVWETSYGIYECVARCFLPEVELHIREFANYEEAKQDYEMAVTDWIAEAGLK